MPYNNHSPQGRVDLRSELVVRYDYGHIVPWVQHQDGRPLLAGGPDAVVVDADVPHQEDDQAHLVAEFSVGEGERVEFSMTCFAVGEPVPASPDAGAEVGRARHW